MKYKTAFSPLAITLGVLIFAGIAHATQQHGEPTGLVVHQIAHLMFVLAMIVLMVVLKRTVGTEVAGWRYLYWAAFFFLVWNFLAWGVHGIQEFIHETAYVGTGYWGKSLSLDTQGGLRTFFYFAKLIAPILNVIPFYFLYRSLKSFAKISE